MCFKELHDELSRKRYEEFYVCPMCGDTDYAAVKQCKVCDEFSEDVQLGRCPDCVDDIVDKFETLIAQHFDIDEIELLNIAYDGKDFGV